MNDEQSPNQFHHC